MPLFVMIGWDGPGSAERRSQHRQAHVAHLRELNGAQRIALAGPIRDEADERSIGAVIVFDSPNLDDARRLVASDPYVVGGVFESVAVKPFKQVIPEPQ